MAYIEKWIKRATPDYYAMFINAWLPFNAWYMDCYYDETAHRTSDKEIITYIRNVDNPYKARIMALLRGNSEDSKMFKNFLGRLHTTLEQHPLPNNNYRISFSRICISAPSSQTLQNTKSFGPYTYKCVYDRTQPKGTNRIKCEIINKRTGQTKYLVEQKDWNEVEFVTLQDYLAITNAKIRNKLLEYYKIINPNKPTDIVCVAETRDDGTFIQPSHSMAIDSSAGVYFKDEIEVVAQVIIQLLYELRCKLFHGEVDVLDCFQTVYKYAFEIQYMLVKELV